MLLWTLSGLTLLLAVLTFLPWWILPYTPLYPKEVKAAAHADRDNTLRIMGANVLTPNRNAGALLVIYLARS